MLYHVSFESRHTGQHNFPEAHNTTNSGIQDGETHSEAPSRVKSILKLLESSPFNQRPGLSWWDSPFQPDVGNHQACHLDESNRPDSPWESCGG